MKNASPIRISTEVALRNSSTRAMVTATCSTAPIIPTMKGERALSGLPELPSLPRRPPLRVGVLEGFPDRVVLFGTLYRGGAVRIGGACSAAAWSS